MRLRQWAPKAAVTASVAALGAGGFLASPAGAAQIAAPTTTSPSITTVAGDGVAGATGDGGLAVKAELKVPNGVVVSASGTMYIADSANSEIRKVVAPTTPNADVISRYAGTGVAGFSGDNGPASQAKLNDPSGVALDGSGDLFIADTGNNRIREVSSTGTIKTIAGTGTCPVTPGKGGGGGTGNGPGLKLNLCGPTGVATMGANLLFTDTGHNDVMILNLSSGMVNTFAGTGTAGNSGDGGKAVNATLNHPTGLYADGAEHVYIADTGNNRVREVTPSVLIIAFAGNGTAGYGGDGGLATGAKLNAPTGVGGDSMGNVYIADTANSRIRKVASGIITTYAGTGVSGFSGDGGPATLAKIASPTGSVASYGTTVFFSDSGNQRVRGVFTGPPPVLPESTYVILLPISGGLLLLLAGGFVFLRHRRRTTFAASL
jgi:hypothetical protein